jgi:hypothetical protein
MRHRDPHDDSRRGLRGTPPNAATTAGLRREAWGLGGSWGFPVRRLNRGHQLLVPDQSKKIRTCPDVSIELSLTAAKPGH